MFRVSTTHHSPANWRDVRRFPTLWWVVFGALTVLAVYLFRPVQATGDGAAYTLQAIGGSAWDRSVHVGYLAPLSIWVRTLATIGCDPAAATNLLTAAWTFVGLGAATALGKELLTAVEPSPTRPIAPILAPLVLASSATVWHATLFCEIYGPLAATITVAAWALRVGRHRTAAVALAWSIAIHPGAVALLPGVLLVGGLPLRSRRSARVAGLAIGAATLVVLAMGADWWTGGRGVLRAAAADQNLFQALQSGWRLVARDVGLPGALLGLGLAVAWSRMPRAVVGLVLVAAGATVGLGRWSDNPGQLPTLFLIAAFAPLALRVPFGASDIGRTLHRLWTPAIVVVALAGVASGTSRHDAEARRAQREYETLQSDCSTTSPEWATETRRTLACGPGEPW